jgi:hypothetical protein
MLGVTVGVVMPATLLEKPDVVTVLYARTLYT